MSPKLLYLTGADPTCCYMLMERENLYRDLKLMHQERPFREYTP